MCSESLLPIDVMKPIREDPQVHFMAVLVSNELLRLQGVVNLRKDM